MLVLCLSCLWGCSYSPTSVQVEIDSSFSPEKREIILQSLQDWSTKTNTGFGVSTVSYVDGLSTETQDNCIKFVNQDVEERNEGPDLTLVGLTDTNYSTVGHPTEHVQATVLVWNEEPDNLFAAATRHEIGHALLVDHYCTEAQGAMSWTACEVVSTDPEPSVMYPVVSLSTTVQPIDAFRFCQRWGCPE